MDEMRYNALCLRGACNEMRHKKKIYIIGVLLVAATLVLFNRYIGPDAVKQAWIRHAQTARASGANEKAPVNYTSKGVQTVAHFSTVTSLIVYDDFSVPANVLRFEETWAEIQQVLDRIDKAVSVSIESSDTSRFNALDHGESIRISKDAANIFKVAREAYTATGGLYDPTVLPLVDLWGFTPRFNTNDYAPQHPYDRIRIGSAYSLPDEKFISSFLKLVDFSRVVLAGDDQTGHTLTKLIPPVTVDGVEYKAQLDFGGIAKGYAVDCVTQLLNERGYEYGSFSCGGSSILLLKNASARSVENGTFRFSLGLSKPRKTDSDESVYMTVAAKDVRLSSSGDYDHSYVLDDTIYSHIIHPKTGYPMNTPAGPDQKGIAVLTILSGSAALDDAMTTALCLMGFEEAIRFYNESMKDYRMTMVLFNQAHSFYEVVTNIPEDEFTIMDPAFVLASHLDGDRNIVYQGTLLK